MSKIGKTSALILVLLFVFLLAFLFLTNVGQTTWSTQNLGYSTPPFIDLVIDKSGVPHIAYTEYENGDIRNPFFIMYATYNGKSWNVENTNICGQVLELRFDSEDNPCMLIELWQLPTPPSPIGLAYVTKINGNWTIQELDSNWQSGTFALDSNGNPHVAFTENDNGTLVLKYASLTTSGWVSEDVDSNVSSIYPAINLALDSNNNPHIMYESNSSSIKYAVNTNSSTFDVRTLLTGVQLDQMVLSPNATPCFLYQKYGSPSNPQNALSYGNWNAVNVSSMNIVSGVQLGGGYLTLGKNGYPYVDYYVGGIGVGKLIYARWTGASWASQTISSKYAQDAGTIAIDSKGKVHVAYPEISGSIYYDIAYLMYATKT